jgi:hypothetical protein
MNPAGKKHSATDRPTAGIRPARASCRQGSYSLSVYRASRRMRKNWERGMKRAASLRIRPAATMPISEHRCDGARSGPTWLRSRPGNPGGGQRKNAHENRVPGIAEDAKPVIHDGEERGQQVAVRVQHVAHVDERGKGVRDRTGQQADLGDHDEDPAYDDAGDRGVAKRALTLFCAEAQNGVDVTLIA